jgi:uncharacterized membrane protein (DUF4010 family)
VSPLLVAIVVSACLGALVGLVRQWMDQSGEPDRAADFGGVRTYTLWALLGCVGAYLTSEYSSAILPVLIAVIAVHLTASHVRSVSNGGTPGSTTFAASLLTCLIGALVEWGFTQPAVVLAALTSVVIGLKQPIHAWTRTISGADIRAMLQFVAITGVILPLVPNQNYGPFGAFNPYSTWLMVVLISGLGFVGYLMMRFLGSSAGITATGLLGGVASSTATTLAFSRRSKEEPELSARYAVAVVLACTIMLARIWVVVGVIHRGLAMSLLVPFALMAVPGLLYSIVVLAFRKDDSPVSPPTLHNPLSLSVSIKFAVIYALVAFLVKAATSLQLQSSLLPLSFVSGLTDLDAIALLMANNLKEGTVLPQLAAQAIIVAAIANSLLKAGFAFTLGSPILRRNVTAVLGATMAIGAACLWFGW